VYKRQVSQQVLGRGRAGGEQDRKQQQDGGAARHGVTSRTDLATARYPGSYVPAGPGLLPASVLRRPAN
jgi:hypothetical protein